ncbi:hypothetical protein ACFYZB_07240 [Streptomyces sp. NPDC001852]|uniref:hypothetical protein n=1 Tax=unclassified Streptomyces TaxID=2593676 RepID=UPI00332B6FF0
MRVRRVLAVAIAAPVLLATIGMTGAAAAVAKPTPGIDKPIPTMGESATQSEPHADKKAGESRESADDEAEEGLLNTIAGELFDRVGPAKGAR